MNNKSDLRQMVERLNLILADHRAMYRVMLADRRWMNSETAGSGAVMNDSLRNVATRILAFRMQRAMIRRELETTQTGDNRP